MLDRAHIHRNDGDNVDSFDRAGYGVGEIGWGRRPAILVVDLQLAFTSPRSPIGGAEHIEAAVKQTASLLSEARKADVPIIHTYVAWAGESEFGRWKIPSLLDITPGSWAAQIDPRVWTPSDQILLKRYPSAFFGTDLSSILQKQEVDTVLVTGATTSGCVRATIIDAFSYGFRTQVVEDCCGDHSPISHADNLRDVGRRYADVIDSGTAIQRLKASENDSPATESIRR